MAASCPSPAHPRRRARAGRRLAAAIAVLAAVLGAAPSPATAHSILLQTTPAAGDHVAALAEVRFEFAAEVATTGHAATVETPTGTVAAVAFERPTPTAIVARFPPDAVPVGDHEVVWQVVAADGHRETGRIPITVDPAPPGTASSPSASPASSVAAAPVAGGESAAADVDEGDADAETESGSPNEVPGEDADADDSSNATLAILLAVAAALLAGWVYRSRRSNRSSG